MPFDVDARVLWNRRLSADYNVLALEAPEIAAATEPGQFVMVKPGHDADPLLRRPFSVFEILRDDDGATTGLTILSKRIGTTTRTLYAAEPGERVHTPRAAWADPSRCPSDNTDVWMVAGGVGLAPFATVAETLAPRGVALTLFYGARRAEELFHLEYFEQLGVRLALATEDGSPRRPRTRHRPAPPSARASRPAIDRF